MRGLRRIGLKAPGRHRARRDLAQHRARSDSSPTASAWTSTLPSAVASTGPASTGRSRRSAVSWHSSSLRAPRRRREPCRCGDRPRAPAARCTNRYLQASETRIERSSSPVPAAGLLTCGRCTTAAMRAGMSPPSQQRRRDQGRTAERRGPHGARAPAARRSRDRSRRARQARRHSWTSHRPMTLRSSRVVPSMPRSLVRLNAAASAPSSGPGELDSEQRPGTRREDGAVRSRPEARRRRPRRCRGRRPCAQARPWRRRPHRIELSAPARDRRPGGVTSPANGRLGNAQARDRDRPPSGGREPRADRWWRRSSPR